MKRIDEDVDPCEDFYLFSCRKFLNDTFLADYESSVDSFSLVSNAVEQQIKTSVEKPVLDTDPHHIKLIKNYYKSCMNTTRVNKYSVDEAKKLLDWPLINKIQPDDNTHWLELYYKLQHIAIEDTLFVAFNVEPDFKNSSRMLISINQPFINYQKKMKDGWKNETVKEYYNYTIELLTFFGADKEQAAEAAKEIFELHIKLAKILVPDEDRRDYFEEYNLKTIKTLQDEYPYIPWLHFINNYTYPIRTLSENDTVLMTVPSYFEKLGPILNGTDFKTIKNYMYWAALRRMLFYLSDDVKNIKQKYKEIASVTATQPRWKDCTYEVMNSLNIAASSLYIKNFFKEQGRQNMIEIVENIKNEFIETLKRIDWMDEETINEAVNKVFAMSQHIAYPDELLDNKKIDDYYKDLITSSESYLNCSISVKRFDRIKGLKQLDKPIDKNDWIPHAGAIETNAYYDQNENSIQFLAGILQGTFFQTDRPQYMNYGAIGYIVGHEITHGFDDEGRQYDKDGNLRNWWPNKTVEAFKKKAKCIQDQYGNLTIPGTDAHINGINCQGENIADNGGVKHAYLAYKKWAESRNEPEKSLPGLRKIYTPEQLFWISAGNLWCSKIKIEQLIKNIDSLTHAPNYFRVNVPLMNNDDFARDFNCPEGSKMNPPKTEKCIVW